MKASLQQRMKFEIAERIIGDSRNFFYLRLFMIKKFEERRRQLQEKSPESPLLEKLKEITVAQEYRSIVFDLIN